MPTVTLDQEPHDALHALIAQAPALLALAENAETLLGFASLARDEVPQPEPDEAEAPPIRLVTAPAPSSTARARI